MYDELNIEKRWKIKNYHNLTRQQGREEKPKAADRNKKERGEQRCERERERGSPFSTLTSYFL